MGLQQSPAASCNKNIITFNNHVINTWPVSKRVALGLLYLPQNLSLFRHLSVSDNLDLVYEHHTYWQGKTKNFFLQEKMTLISQIKLEHALNQEVDVLSGGQKRKLEIARALLMHATCLMLDEPFAGVDPKSIYELKLLFESIITQGITIIISDHHVDQLLSIATLVYVIMNGEVIVRGTPKAILEDQQTKDSYLGNYFYQEISGRFLE